MEKIDSSNDIITQQPSNPFEKNQTIEVKIGTGEDITITSKKNTDKPAFMMVGNGKINHKLDKGTDVMDFIKLMAHMTPQELFVVEQIKDKLIKDTFEKVGKNGKTYKEEYFTNIAFVKMSDLLNAEQQKFKKGYGRLNDKNIVRRVKNSYYIFNPSFIIPRFYEDTLKQWNKSNSKKSENITPPSIEGMI